MAFEVVLTQNKALNILSLPSKNLSTNKERQKYCFFVKATKCILLVHSGSIFKNYITIDQINDFFSQNSFPSSSRSSRRPEVTLSPELAMPLAVA